MEKEQQTNMLIHSSILCCAVLPATHIVPGWSAAQLAKLPMAFCLAQCFKVFLGRDTLVCMVLLGLQQTKMFVFHQDLIILNITKAQATLQIWPSIIAPPSLLKNGAHGCNMTIAAH